MNAVCKKLDISSNHIQRFPPRVFLSSFFRKHQKWDRQRETFCSLWFKNLLSESSPLEINPKSNSSSVPYPIKFTYNGLVRLATYTNTSEIEKLKSWTLFCISHFTLPPPSHPCPFVFRLPEILNSLFIKSPERLACDIGLELYLNFNCLFGC